MSAGLYRFFGQQQMWEEEGGKILVTVFDVVHGSNPALTQAQRNALSIVQNITSRRSQKRIEAEEFPYI